jgi:hypothetical protein
MIRVSAQSGALVQRLRERAARMATSLAGSRSKGSATRRHNWRSAAELWPDFTGDRNNGK